MNREITRGRVQDKAAMMPIRRPSRTRDCKILPSGMRSFPGSDLAKIHAVFSSMSSAISTPDGAFVKTKQGPSKSTTTGDTRNAKTPRSVLRTVRFEEHSYKVEVLSLDDYSEEEHQSCWYSKNELRTIRDQSDTKSNDRLSSTPRSPLYATRSRWNETRHT